MNTITQCSRCILDTTDDPNIVFNTEGVCNHCLRYDRDKLWYLKSGNEAKELIDEYRKFLEQG